MLDAVKAEIHKAYDKLSLTIAGFQRRESQTQMLDEVADALCQDPDDTGGEDGENAIRRIAVIEGQTGTGKSVGYMLGAIPVAQQLGKTLVISTATVALQDQIVNKDLPMILEKAGLSFNYRLAKGRGRYACTRNVVGLNQEEHGQQGLNLDSQRIASWERPPQEGERETIDSMAKMLSNGKWDGDLDKWSEPIAPSLRNMITTSSSGCTRKSCEYAENCPFYDARDELGKVDVVVANHDLVLSDLALGGGAVLTKPAETIYVFDEGHHLPDKAISHLSGETSIRGGKKALESVRQAVDKAVRDCPEMVEDPKTISDAEADAKKALDQTEDAIISSFPGADAKEVNASNDIAEWCFSFGKTPEAFLESAREVAKAALRMEKNAGDLLEKLKEEIKDESKKDKLTPLIQDLGVSLSKVENLREVWWTWSNPQEDDDLPVARWVRRDLGRDELTVATSSISAAKMLRNALWECAYGVVVTSATITALNSFKRFQRASGLSHGDGTRYVRLMSPFDYEKNGVLEVPDLGCDPTDQTNHTKAVAKFIEERVDASQGSLVLFTSNWQMNKVADLLPKDVRKLCLIQGSMSRNAILERHREAIESGQGSIIMGVASFSEGVDLPGELCTHVVISKLPFSVPTTPVERTRTEFLEGKGYNPFVEVAVPDASLKLIQAVGRLIRSEEDTGRVSILDRRIVSKPYGKGIMNSLPPFRREVG